MFITIVLYAIQMLTPQYTCLSWLELFDDEIQMYEFPKSEPKLENKVSSNFKVPVKYEPFPPEEKKGQRRHWLMPDSTNQKQPSRTRYYEDEKDSSLKNKIATLVQQTLHDTERRWMSVQDIRAEHRDQLPYKAGYILNLMQKNKNMLDELFTVATKHKEQWLALEQLKIFEVIIHTRVDIANYLTQLVDIHERHLNSTHALRKKV